MAAPEAPLNGRAPTEGCRLCADLAAAERGADPWTVARLTTGYVRLNPVQYYAGAALFVAKDCVTDLHELSEPIRAAHLAEMAQVALVLRMTFGAQRLSYEAPSHVGRHLHWWLTPRHADDPHPTGSIWQDPDFLHIYWAGGAEPGDQGIEDARQALLDALGRQSLTIERGYPA